jgi:hypothetical protein
LGVFANGSTVDVEDWQVEGWKRSTNREWPESGTLELPEQLPVNPTNAQMSGELEAAIIERQSKRTPEQVIEEERAGIKAQLSGDLTWTPGEPEAKARELIQPTNTVVDLLGTVVPPAKEEAPSEGVTQQLAPEVRPEAAAQAPEPGQQAQAPPSQTTASPFEPPQPPVQGGGS